MKLKTFILSAIAVIGMATPAFAKNTKVNVSSTEDQTTEVAEHDMNVYGANYTDGDKFDGLTRKVGFDRMIPLTHWKSRMKRRHTSSSPRRLSMLTSAMRTSSPDLPTVRKMCCVSNRLSSRSRLKQTSR